MTFHQFYCLTSIYEKVVDIEVMEGVKERGVVMFKTEEEAREAVKAMDGGFIDLQQIVVSLRWRRTNGLIDFSYGKLFIDIYLINFNYHLVSPC